MALNDIVIDRDSQQLLNAIDITDGASATGTAATALGAGSQASGDHSTCIGGGATASGEHGTAVGSNSSASASSAALGAGAKANGSGSIAIGSTAKTTNNGDISIGGGAEARDAGTAIGNGAKGNGNVSISVGTLSEATGARSISVGYSAKATAENSIQVGEGTNAAANTAKIKNTTILNAQGKIPIESTDIQAGENITIEFSSAGSVISASGGTTDYTQLTNKPQVNGNTLSGNKTSAELGLQGQLVSGTNIKTVNGTSLLGSGNIEITGGLPDLPSVAYNYATAQQVFADTTNIPDGLYRNTSELNLITPNKNVDLVSYANGIVHIERGETSVISSLSGYIMKYPDNKWYGGVYLGYDEFLTEIDTVKPTFFDCNITEQGIESTATYGEIYEAFTSGVVLFRLKSQGELIGITNCLLATQTGTTVTLTISSQENPYVYVGSGTTSETFSLSKQPQFATQQYVDTAVGDIETALQDLHTALQGLISGGGVE